MRDVCFGIAGRQTKLARAAAQQANLRSTQTLREEHLRAAIALDTGHGFRTAQRIVVLIENRTDAATEERVGAAEVLRRELRDFDPAQPAAGFQRMLAHDERRVVRQLDLFVGAV